MSHADRTQSQVHHQAVSLLILNSLLRRICCGFFPRGLTTCVYLPSSNLSRSPHAGPCRDESTCTCPGSPRNVTDGQYPFPPLPYLLICVWVAGMCQAANSPSRPLLHISPDFWPMQLKWMELWISGHWLWLFWKCFIPLTQGSALLLHLVLISAAWIAEVIAGVTTSHSTNV